MEEFSHRLYLDERERYYNIVTNTIESHVQAVGHKAIHDPEFQVDVDSMDRAFNKWCKTARRLPIELVRSRRKKFPTARYLSLMAEYRDHTNDLEGNITMLILKYRS